MEELLLLEKSEEDINIELYEIIERLPKNDYSSALGDLELLRYLLHKTYDLNVKTANIDQFNSQWVIINSVISMLLERKVITTNRFSHIGIGISITVRNKNYFIDTCYLAQL